MRNADAKIAYRTARERYAALGVDTDKALRQLAKIPISMHCWQGDDVGGFEKPTQLDSGGIKATGNYPGKARTAVELRRDIEKAFTMIPGRHRINLHALYADFSRGVVDRNALTSRQFTAWADWAHHLKIGVDFNGTFFAHPKANSGFTLASADKGIRNFWIEHGIACREIGAYLGRTLGSPCVVNLWIPDGYKDAPVERHAARARLMDSLDRIFARRLNPRHVLDAVEGKLFGIGSESCVIGSHEFYLGYAITRNKLVTLDMGHYHPTESVADKISAVMPYVSELLLHVSRGVRWDSDHVVTLSDDLRELAAELVRGNYLDRTHIGLDYFDASINRVAAWVIGMRNMQKALLLALLEPATRLRNAERSGDYTTRLAMLESSRFMPAGAIWDYFCVTQDAPGDDEWLDDVKQYEAAVLAKRR